MVKNKAPKIGVFLCHCGKNISSIVDISQLKKELEEVDPNLIVKEDIFLCSEGGQKKILDSIKDDGLDRVVIASCSPAHHGSIFSKCIGELLNPYMWEMANIREQCSWVHSDAKTATSKAKSLILGAVNRVRNHEPIGTVDVDMNQDVLVIGAGIAGMHASLELAAKGHKVHLVEQTSSIGGNMARLDRTFPTNDCAMCTISPIMNDIAANKNIILHTLSTVEDFSGRAGMYKVKIKKRTPFIDLDKCVGCGLCAEACRLNNKISDEFNLGIGKRGAAYIPFSQAVPLKYSIDPNSCLMIKTGRCGKKGETPPCVVACEVKAIDHSLKDEEIEITVGGVIVATGYEQFDLSGTEFNIENPNVITGLQMERMLTPTGPTEGHVIKPSNLEKPKSVTFIQCAGSRDERYCKYCSDVCCLYTTKNAMLLRLDEPDIEINVVYIDYRTGGRFNEEYYRRLRGMNINMIKGRPSEILDGPNDTLVLDVFDKDTGKLVQIISDLVVLAAAMVPSAGSRDIIDKLHLVFGPDKFATPTHIKISPVDTSTAGVFIAGTVTGPKSIPESITDAAAAAARLSTFLQNKKMTVNLDKAYINGDLCIKCGLCDDLCNYDAIDTSKDTFEVLPVSCHGCGMCAGVCPTNAIDLRQYLDLQVESQVRGILEAEKNVIIAYCCAQCGYNAADIAGTARSDYPEDIRIVRLPCSGRISLDAILMPFNYGARGVMVVGCLEDQCHYIDGNISAKERALKAKKALDLLGIGGHRLEFFNMSSADGHKFVEAAKRMVKQC